MNTIKLEGIIKLDEVAGFHEQLQKDITKDEDLCFDMSDLEEIDTSGLQLLISLSEQMRKSGHKTQIKDCDDDVKDHLRLLNVTELFDIAI